MFIPAWVAIPFRAVFFTLALVVFVIFLAGSAVAGAVQWWWEQVRG